MGQCSSNVVAWPFLHNWSHLTQPTRSMLGSMLADPINCTLPDSASVSTQYTSSQTLSPTIHIQYIAGSALCCNSTVAGEIFTAMVMQTCRYTLLTFAMSCSPISMQDVSKPRLIYILHMLLDPLLVPTPVYTLSIDPPNGSQGQNMSSMDCISHNLVHLAL